MILLDSSLSDAKEILVSTCHLNWNPNLPEVKLGQVQYILKRLELFQQNNLLRKTENKPLPTILCGDFNSFPGSEVYNLISGHINNEKARNIISSLTKQREQSGSSYIMRRLYGPKTRFLCDPTLSRLSRWMRVLGIDVAMSSWESGSLKPVKQTPKTTGDTINAFFNRAKREERVILTTSKSLRQRSACPQSYYVDPKDLEKALVEIYHEYGLELSKETFLTVKT